MEQKIWSAVRSFLGWLEANGVESHDPYDLWGTRYGLFARRHYYTGRRFGTILVAPLVAAEVLIPSASRCCIRKERYATAEAQLVLGFLNLHAITADREFLARAVRQVEGLLELSIPGYSGHCWGYPFDWQNSGGMWARRTPFITVTPYCFEAFLGMADATSEEKYLEVAASIARFVAHDLRDTRVSVEASAGSYSPEDNSLVVNASAYRAWVLFEASQRFHEDSYREIAQRNLRFILDSQRQDGSWLYALEGRGQGFIDHFHTCFVLKNLQKLNRILGSLDVESAIQVGWDYYRRALFHDDERPKSYAIEPRLQLARVEVYNFAEAITLGTLLRPTLHQAFALAQRMVRTVIDDYQLPDGHFVTREYRGGLKHTTPFLRWPQAQMFLALTNMLRELSAQASHRAHGALCDSATEVPFR